MSHLTVGVTGAGETSLRNASALIEDWADAQGADVALTVALDLTVDEAGELPRAVQAAASFALKYGLDIEAILPQGQKEPADNELLLAVLEAAKTTVRVANPIASVARRSGVLFVAWEEEDDDGTLVPTAAAIKALEAAERFSVPAHDLTDGLLPLAFDDGQSEAEETAEEADTQRPDESTSSVRSDLAPEPQSDSTDTDGSVNVEALATAVAAAVLAEITPLIEQIAKQTAPRPRGRPRKTTEED